METNAYTNDVKLKCRSVVVDSMGSCALNKGAKMPATIKVFAVGGKCFRHVMNADHDSVELRDEDDRTLLTFSGDAKVFDESGRVGCLNIDFVAGHPCWL